MVAGKRADGRENTHLDLGRLEGRDGAGERGGNAGHFCSCFFVLKKGKCAGMAREIEDTPLCTAGIKIFWEDRGIGRWSGQFRVPGCRVKSPMLDQMPIPNLCSISQPGSYFHKTGTRREPIVTADGSRRVYDLGNRASGVCF